MPRSVPISFLWAYTFFANPSIKSSLGFREILPWIFQHGGMKIGIYTDFSHWSSATIPSSPTAASSPSFMLSSTSSYAHLHLMVSLYTLAIVVARGILAHMDQVRSVAVETQLWTDCSSNPNRINLQWTKFISAGDYKTVYDMSLLHRQSKRKEKFGSRPNSCSHWWLYGKKKLLMPWTPKTCKTGCDRHLWT